MEFMLVSEKIIDVHIHPLLKFITEEHLLKELRQAGVDLGVLLALDVDPQDVDRPRIKDVISQRLLDLYVWDAQRVMENIRVFLQMIRTDNEQVIGVIKRYPGKFVGFGSINLSKGDAYVEEKLKEIDRLKLRGVKLIPTLQFFNPSRVTKKMEKVFEYCEKKKKIVMCHTGCDPYVWEAPEFSEDANPKYLRWILSDFEDVPVILAHMGCYSSRSPGIWLDEALKLGKQHENAWFDISAVTYVVTRKKFVNKIRKTVGMDRILFGSDYPAVQGVSIKSIVAEVKNSKYLTEEEKRKILSLNAAKLLDL